MSETKGPEINWFGATGSALGSVTSAVLLSTLGASGTVIGAGLGTLIIGVGGSVYAYYLQRAKSNIEKTAENAIRTRRYPKRPKNGQPNDTAPISAQKDATSISAEKDPTAANPENSTAAMGATRLEAPKPKLKEVLRDMPWKRVAWWVAGLFALTMAIVLVFELATGRPVSSYTGGTSPSSSGTSLTGVTDPAREDPQWTPEQEDNPEVEQLPEVPAEIEEEPLPDEEPQFPNEQDMPQEAPQEQPEQAPLQEEPIEPVEPVVPAEPTE